MATSGMALSICEKSGMANATPAIPLLPPLLSTLPGSIGVNRPDHLGGTVLNSAAVSRCPALLAFNPDFPKLLTV